MLTNYLKKLFLKFRQRYIFDLSIQFMQDNFSLNKHQRNTWAGEFGDSYVERNKTIDQVNASFDELMGITLENLLSSFFSDLNRDTKILEVGCNVGLNLTILKKMGFKNLFGLEINEKAITIAKQRNPEITFFHSSIEKFETEHKFDLIFTAGVLIHINPDTLPDIIKKIYGLTNKFIFGYENFSEDLTKLDYREHTNILWKQNFPKLYRELFPDLKTVTEKIYSYKNNDLQDVAFLLEKP